jgi:hypothetical protein
MPPFKTLATMATYHTGFVHPSSVKLLRICSSYEYHNLLEYNAVNFSTCVGRLCENLLLGGYKALVSIYQVTCIRSRRPWRSYSSGNCKCHWLRGMFTYGYIGCVCVFIYIYIYICNACFMPERNCYK